MKFIHQFLEDEFLGEHARSLFRLLIAQLMVSIADEFIPSFFKMFVSGHLIVPGLIGEVCIRVFHLDAVIAT